MTAGVADDCVGLTHSMHGAVHALVFDCPCSCDAVSDFVGGTCVDMAVSEGALNDCACSENSMRVLALSHENGLNDSLHSIRVCHYRASPFFYGNGSYTSCAYLDLFQDHVQLSGDKCACAVACTCSLTCYVLMTHFVSDHLGSCFVAIQICDDSAHKGTVDASIVCVCRAIWGSTFQDDKGCVFATS
eukprot:4040835-Amphidinium_carterae.1